MARRVLADFDAELLLHLGNRTDISSTLRAQYLNDAVLAIAVEFPHPELELVFDDSIPSGSYYITPANTDLWWPMMIKDIDNNRMIDCKSMQEIEANVRTSGTVTQYYWFSNVLYFDRTASATTDIRIWGKERPDSMGTGESSPLDEQYDVLIALKAAVFALNTVGNIQAAHIKDTEYNNIAAPWKLPRVEATKDDRNKHFRVRMR